MQATLTFCERLKQLQKEGLIYRKVISEKPIRVKYGLTDKGDYLLHVLDVFFSEYPH